MTTFLTYLTAQHRRHDPVGDLARDTRDVIRAGHRPPTTFKDWHAFLRQRRACPEAHKALTDAFREYQRQRAVRG